MTDTIRQHVEAMGVDPTKLLDTDEYFEVVAQVPIGQPGTTAWAEAQVIDPNNPLRPGDFIEIRRRIGALGESVKSPWVLLDEQFDTLDPALWITKGGTPTADGRLVMPMTYPMNTVWYAQTVTPVNRHFQVNGINMPKSPNETGKGRSVQLINPSATYQLAAFNITSGSMSMRTNMDTAKSLPFDPVAHANLRFRCDGTSLFFEASPSGDAGSWTSVRTPVAVTTNPWLKNPAIFQIAAGSSVSTASDATTVATIDRALIRENIPAYV